MVSYSVPVRQNWLDGPTTPCTQRLPAVTTRYYHGEPLTHHRQLIGQKLVCVIADAKSAICKVIMNHPWTGAHTKVPKDSGAVECPGLSAYVDASPLASDTTRNSTCAA
jgi:hypothetical protein